MTPTYQMPKNNKKSNKAKNAKREAKRIADYSKDIVTEKYVTTGKTLISSSGGAKRGFRRHKPSSVTSAAVVREMFGDVSLQTRIYE